MPYCAEALLGLPGTCSTQDFGNPSQQLAWGQTVHYRRAARGLQHRAAGTHHDISSLYPKGGGDRVLGVEGSE